MKYYTKTICCLALGFAFMNSTGAQDSDLLKQCIIPATDDHDTIKFGMLVPPSYDNNPGAYPVIYYLHGMNRYYLGPRAQWIASFFQKQFSEGQLPECVMVFIDGGEGWWCNHYDGDPMLETEIVNYLIPHVDQTHRTDPSRRMIMGYSMGGNGAIFFYAKHPELFVAAASLDGGIVTYEDYLNRTGGRPDIISDKDYFLAYGSPYGWVKRNREALMAKADTSILLTAGFLADANKEFLSLLKEEEIPAKYLEFGYDHEFGYVFSESQDELIKFIAERLN